MWPSAQQGQEVNWPCDICGKATGAPWWWIEYRHGETGEKLVSGIAVCSVVCARKALSRLNKAALASQGLGKK